MLINSRDNLQWDKFTANGDLDHVMENGVTVGQEVCRAMAAHGHPNLGPHDVSSSPLWLILV